MALKSGRYEVNVEMGFRMNETSDPGYVVCFGNLSGSIISASGEGMDHEEGKNLVHVATSASGLKPCGLLLTKVVNVDTTRYHLNFYKEEVNVTQKVSVLRKGWIVTNAISGTPAAGDKAYLTSSGQVTPTLSTTGGLVATPLVGQFLSKKDEDGYAKVEIELPN
jgi:hypothetical protein